MARREAGAAPTHLIAIIGSAGALEPLIAIVRRLTPDIDAAIVVLIHRAATGPMYLPEILSRAALLPVVTVAGGESLQPARIYVVPPGDRHAIVERNIIRLVWGAKVSFHRPAGNPLLDSVAASFGSRSIGVILSGMGHNGAAGVAAIKHAGGKVLVQSPAEAKHPTMPEYAQRMATPDLSAPAAEIGHRLVQLCGGTGGEPDRERIAAGQG